MIKELEYIDELILQVERMTNQKYFTCKVKKVIDIEGTVRNPNDEEFPNNNQLFMTDGAEQLKAFFKIRNETDNFQKKLLFRIKGSDIEFNASGDLYKQDKTKTKWVARTYEEKFFYNIKIYNIPSFIPKLNFNFHSFSRGFPEANQAFFIKNDSSLFGPFTFNKLDDALLGLKFSDIYSDEFSELRENELVEIGLITDDTFLIGENDSFIFEFELNNPNLKTFEDEGNEFLLKLPKKSKRRYFFGDFNELELFVKSKLTKINKTDFELINKLFKERNEFNRLSDQYEIDKVNAYFDIISNTSNFYKEELPKILEKYLETDEGKPILEKLNILIQPEQESNEEYIKTIEAKEIDIKQLNDKIEELNKNTRSVLKDLGFESEDEKNHFFSNKEKILSIVKEDLKLKDLYKEVGRVEHEYNTRKKQIIELNTQEQTIIQSIETHLKQFSNPTDISAALLTFQTTSEIISGQYNKRKNIRNLEKPFIIPKSLNAEISFEEYRTEVAKNLKILGRTFNPETLSNYLLTLELNFLTILLGYPGVGKTSLVERLAKANGLINQGENRFKKITIEKGWNSTRDLLGFYNSITDNWIDSKTKLIQVLEQLNFEHRYSHNASPFWVLLDEANLSPIENYWSSFNSIADDDNKKELILEDNRYFTWNNEKLKFVATVNFDYTTEPISPRLINRAAVIKLDLPSALIETKEFPLLESPIANKVLLEKKSQKTIKKRLESIKYSLLDGIPIILSPRKENAIEIHFKHLEPILGDELQALDFALHQHLLPLISGQGKAFIDKIDRLNKILSDLPKCQSELSNIREKGDTLHMYSFFNI